MLTLNIDISGKTAVVAGGGKVAERKVNSLMASGATIRLVSPTITSGLLLLAKDCRIAWIDREYCCSDIHGAFLVVAATDNREVNNRIATDAKKSGLLVNVTDAPDDGNCSFPAILRRGRLELAVSTGGASPAMAAAVRDELSSFVDESWGDALELVATLREKLLTHEDAEKYNAKLVKELFVHELLLQLRSGDNATADEFIRASLERLGLDPDLRP